MGLSIWIATIGVFGYIATPPSTIVNQAISSTAFPLLLVDSSPGFQHVLGGRWKRYDNIIEGAPRGFLYKSIYLKNLLDRELRIN